MCDAYCYSSYSPVLVLTVLKISAAVPLYRGDDHGEISALSQAFWVQHRIPQITAHREVYSVPAAPNNFHYSILNVATSLSTLQQQC